MEAHQIAWPRTTPARHLQIESQHQFTANVGTECCSFCGLLPPRLGGKDGFQTSFLETIYAKIERCCSSAAPAFACSGLPPALQIATYKIFFARETRFPHVPLPAFRPRILCIAKYSEISVREPFSADGTPAYNPSPGVGAEILNDKFASKIAAPSMHQHDGKKSSPDRPPLGTAQTAT